MNCLYYIVIVRVSDALCLWRVLLLHRFGYGLMLMPMMLIACADQTSLDVSMRNMVD